MTGVSVRLWAAALLAAMSVPGVASAGVDSLAWMEGVWHARVGKDGSREEIWGAPLGGTMIGAGREVRDGTLLEFEFLLLREEPTSGGEPVVYYDAYVGGASPVSFRLTESGDQAAVFTNPAHDFPTRIAYRLDEVGSLQVSVSGPDGSGFELRFTRDPRTHATSRLPELRDLWNWNDAKASEEAFRGLLPRARSAGDLGFELEVRTQVARALGLQSRFEEAHSALDRVEEQLEGAGSRARLRYLLERGRALRSSGHPAEALPFFIEGWELGRSSGQDGLAVDAAHMVALVEAGEEILAWNLRALELAQSSPAPAAQRWRASLFNNIGWTHHDAGRFDEALALFEEAVPLRREQAKAAASRQAEWCVARALRSLGRIDDALAIQERLHAEWEAEGGADGYVDEEIAECLQALDRPDEARPWFAKAHAALASDPWMVEHEGERLARLERLGAD
jgi:tetratricopeptide (TPR) repeat protein